MQGDVEVLAAVAGEQAPSSCRTGGVARLGVGVAGHNYQLDYISRNTATLALDISLQLTASITQGDLLLLGNFVMCRYQVRGPRHTDGTEKQIGLDSN